MVVKPGIQIDLRIGEPEAMGAMLQYFTGSQQHNIRLRDFANRMGLSLNEYGITNVESGEVEVFPDEESFYARLGLPWIPPELRAGMWELDAAQQDSLPRLVKAKDLRGDLHLHSEWSDGSDTIEIQKGAIAPGDRIVVLDDLLATGGTMRAAADLLRQCGGDVRGGACIIELTFLGGRGRQNMPVTTLVSYDE